MHIARSRLLLYLSYVGAALLGFIVFVSPMDNTPIEIFLMFIFISASSTASYIVWTKHNYIFNLKGINWKLLIYVPFTYLFIISFELLVNYHRFIAGTSPIGHLQKHVLSYWWQFPLIFILSWYFFQKFSLKNAMVATWILGALFESFFIARSILGILSGLLWVWILTSCWMITKYIIEHKRITK